MTELKVDDNGAIIDGEDFPIGKTGWKLRAEKDSICEKRTQLIDPMGCVLMEGAMMEPDIAALDLSQTDILYVLEKKLTNILLKCTRSHLEKDGSMRPVINHQAGKEAVEALRIIKEYMKDEE